MHAQPVDRHPVSRAHFLGVGAGLAVGMATNAFDPLTALAGNGRLIPQGKVGTITFTQRDVPGRLAIATGNPPLSGFLGGANFPEDPTDLGPLVPLPGGWRELFQFFADVGIHQVEFAGYGQNASNPGGTATDPSDGNATGGRRLPRLRPPVTKVPR